MSSEDRKKTFVPRITQVNRWFCTFSYCFLKFWEIFDIDFNLFEFVISLMTD